MTQVVLAGLVGRSADWIGKVERGDRALNRLDVLAQLARALRVEVADLVGQPVLVEDAERDDDVPAIRDALMTPRQLSRVLYGDVPDPASVDPAPSGRLIEAVWSDFQHGRIGRVITALPRLIETAQRLEDVAYRGKHRRACLAVSARVHHLAATTLIKIGEVDLAWIAAERAMRAADDADNPLVLASAARAGTHTLLAAGRYRDALDLGATAARWLKTRVDAGDPDALSLFGMLNLRTAVAAARHNDRTTATELLDQSARAADRLGGDANRWQTGFGPTNVELHKLSIALDLGDVSQVIAHGPSVRTGHMPIERSASHLIDLARALSLAAQDDAALDRLLAAEQVAPTLVRHNPVVRETVKDLHRRARATSGKRSSALPQLAERCRALK